MYMYMHVSTCMHSCSEVTTTHLQSMDVEFVHVPICLLGLMGHELCWWLGFVPLFFECLIDWTETRFKLVIDIVYDVISWYTVSYSGCAIAAIALHIRYTTSHRETYTSRNNYSAYSRRVRIWQHPGVATAAGISHRTTWYSLIVSDD